MKPALTIDVVTLFPELFEPVIATSITGRAVSMGALRVRLHQLRAFGLGKHRSVDDTPYGGGSGMVMRVDCLVNCLESIDALDATDADGTLRAQINDGSEAPPSPGALRLHRVLLTPQGKRLDQRKVFELVERGRFALICGRYEGFDDRILHFVDEEISLGDFVLAGGEVAAMAIIDACGRLLPGVLGNAASAISESHSPAMAGLLEYPQFTRPAVFRGHAVPEILSSGDHARVDAYRKAEAERRTAERRPDLWAIARGSGSNEGAGS